ncbi:MAG TPA: hypothetical protein PK177_00045, partial [Burkholderiaceae bacterium]|nr:hypothetical protein [Burkholderiaceae bacterium]
PVFRLPDLLSACVSLATAEAAEADAHAALRDFLTRELLFRDRDCAKRSCAIWRPQFELLMVAHRAPWNAFPHPRFDLVHLTTACVAIARRGDDPVMRVLHQARLNLTARYDGATH